ncbi:helix-turn-helix domain-containing protein [Actinomadura madurae]|uniref:helix-turn-helix domain-containing protein n=1 Tax=Actinomadura madurae TaxID=1993 RepID=UPI003558B70A
MVGRPRPPRVPRPRRRRPGTATAAGHELRDSVERLTDDLAHEPWRALGAAEADRLAQLTMPILVKVLETGLMPPRTPSA